jgi:Ala-tRNA(Pro) deacylase
MSVAVTVKTYLDRASAHYSLVSHPHTRSSLESAASAHIPSERLAKAVIVNRGDDHLMVVVPSQAHIHLGLLHRHLRADVGLATESELASLFPDCELGAIPPLGAAYGMRTLMDRTLRDGPEVYFESGDHESLVRVSRATFRTLMADAEPVAVIQTH